MTRILTITLLLLSALPDVAAQTASDKRADAEVRALLEQARVAALRSDVKFYEQYLADAYLETNTDGKTFTKAEILKGWQTLPPSLKLSSELSELTLAISENTAVAHYRLNWQNEMPAQTVKFIFRVTDVLKRHKGRWQLITEHYSNIPKPRAIAQVAEKVLDDYVGQYQSADSFTSTITREGNKLIEQFSGTVMKTELFPENETTFWPREENTARIFVRNQQGQVTHLLVRLPDGQEFPAKKIR